jgi:hypothetical protein
VDQVLGVNASRRFAPWLAIAASSCVGSIPGRDGPARPADPDPPAAGAPPEACEAAVPWRTTTLTRAQYIHAAGDLLGIDPRPLLKLSDVGGRTFTAGVSLTSLQVEQRMITAEAIAIAATTPDQLPRLLPCDPAPDEAACADRTIERLGSRAFRRPLDREATAALRKLFDEGQAAGGFATGVQWLIAGLLQAPDFLYHLPPTPAGRPGTVVALDPYTLGSRLSFFLWNSPPDAELLAAADEGSLAQPGVLAAQVRRLLADPKAARAREDHYGTWLRLDELEKIARDVRELTPDLVAQLRRSALLGIEEVYRGGGKVEDLLGTSTLFASDGLARLYGLAAPGGADLRPVAAPPEQRRGLLTHPAWLALLANPDSSDPIQRGLFVVEKVLCQDTPDPLDMVPDLPPLRAGLSTRARLEQHRASPVCAACHRLFDPPGMAFESYDAIGRYRQSDQGVPVDSSGEIALGLDLDGTFASGSELLERMTRSGAVRDCLARHWFEYAVSRRPEAADRCALDPIQARFRQSGDLVELLGALAETPTFGRQLVAEE